MPQYVYSTSNYITKALCLITSIQLLYHPVSETNNLYYGITIVLLGWFLSWCASLLRQCNWIESFCYISRFQKLIQLNKQVHCHLNVIYSHGADTHKCTHIYTHTAGLEQPINKWSGIFKAWDDLWKYKTMLCWIQYFIWRSRGIGRCFVVRAKLIDDALVKPRTFHQ